MLSSSTCLILVSFDPLPVPGQHPCIWFRSILAIGGLEGTTAPFKASQSLTAQAIRGLSFCFSYIDDLLIASPDPATHFKHLHALFERLAEHGLVIQPSKCQFAASELDFLSHHVSDKGITPLASNVFQIMDYQQPSTTHALRRFLGLVNFYHMSVPHCTDILVPLHLLLASHPLKPKHAPLTWNDSALKAFRDIKTALRNATLLNYPAPSAELCFMTDASQTGIGGVLQQNIGDAWQLIAFFSRKLEDTQRRHSTFGRKLLAVPSAIKHFRQFLEGRNFSVATDHQALTSALASPPDHYNPREVCHLHFISEFTTDIRHLPGDANPVADDLSRSSLNQLASAVDFVALSEAQTSDNELAALRARSDSALTWENHPCPTGNTTLVVDVSTDKPRPFVPVAFRRAVFNSLHSISNPGIRATQRLIGTRYVWPSMHRDICDWTKTYTACQKPKVYCHTVTPTGTVSLPNSRFDTVHIDLVGQFPPARGYRYLLTCVDRFSRWPEAIPITDTIASTIADAFVSHWIARFGVPLTVPTDRGAQFESQLFTSLLKFLGSTRILTTSYHPCANGLVERFHRQLKASLYAQANPLNLLQNLPLVLLGIRSALKPDVGGSAAEVVYGCGLRVPGEFLAPTTGSTLASPGDLVIRLRQFAQ